MDYSYPSAFQPRNGTSSSNKLEFNTIKVVGEGTVSVAPDQAFINIGVITESMNLSVAQTENTKKMTNVIQSLIKLGIPKERIQTVVYRIDMQYDYQDGKQLLRGYQVNHQIQVKVDQIEHVGSVVDTAVESGANSISDIRFTVKQQEAYYNQALTLALDQTQQKASTLANRMGVTLQPYPYLIQEFSQTIQPPPYPTLYAAKAEAAPIQPGEIQITANLHAEYLFVKP